MNFFSFRCPSERNVLALNSGARRMSQGKCPNSMSKFVRPFFRLEPRFKSKVISNFRKTINNTFNLIFIWCLNKLMRFKSPARVQRMIFAYFCFEFRNKVLRDDLEIFHSQWPLIDQSRKLSLVFIYPNTAKRWMLFHTFETRTVSILSLLKLNGRCSIYHDQILCFIDYEAKYRFFAFYITILKKRITWKNEQNK